MSDPKYKKPDSGYWENVRKLRKEQEFKDEAEAFLTKKSTSTDNNPAWGKKKGMKF